MRLLAVCGVGTLVVLASFFARPESACAEDDEGVCAEDNSNRCADILTSGKSIWFEIANVGNTMFYARPHQLLEDPPKWGLGTYKPNTWDTGKAPDGSFWVANAGSTWTGQCTCYLGGLPAVLPSGPHDITVTRVRMPPPPTRFLCDDPNMCDPGDGG